MREKLDKMAIRAIRDMVYVIDELDGLRISCKSKHDFTDIDRERVDAVWLSTFEAEPFGARESVAAIFKSKIIMILVKLNCSYLRHKLRKMYKVEKA